MHFFYHDTYSKLKFIYISYYTLFLSIRYFFFYFETHFNY